MYVTTDLDCLALVVVEGGREQSPPRIWTMSATATTQGSYDRTFSQGSSCVYYVTEGAARSVLTLLIWNQRSTPPPDECCFSDKHNVRREYAGLHALSGHVLNGSTCCAFQCSSMRSLRFSPSAMRLIHTSLALLYDGSVFARDFASSFCFVSDLISDIHQCYA